VEAQQRQAQARPAHGREHLGPPEEPGQQARIRPRPARPAAQGQNVRLRHPAPRQAEAEGLLRRHHREAVQAHLFRGLADARRQLAEPDWPARTPAGHGGLPRQVRADDLGRAPDRQPRPRPGERRALQHRIAPRRHRRRGVPRAKGAGDGAGARGAKPRRARCARLPRRRRLGQGHLHPGAAARRGALPGADGAEPRGGVLLPL
ncbi:MAG: SSU ribosomal protein S4p (S9e) @ SSU ribosomal protein S4p (S9e), zinc-independent, partial [uncultured Sphingomonadaceae bacterium]